MSILVIDGVKYEAWTPTNEDEFERVVKEHAEDIFGEQSMYLDIKPKLKSKSGIGSIPDGYVVIFGEEPHWHIVEVELSSHPLYEHIVPQVGKFISGIKNPSTQKDIINALFQEIDSDEFLRLRLRKAIGTTETYKFLADLVSKSPVVTIIIEKRTEQLDEAIEALRHPQIKIVEFQTFAREGVGFNVHAHLFEPVYSEKIKEQIPQTPTSSVVVSKPRTLEHTLDNNEFKNKRFKFSKDKGSFFPSPGEKGSIKIKADGETYDAWVYRYKGKGAPRIRGVPKWFDKNNDLKDLVESGVEVKVIFTYEGPGVYQLRKA